LTVPPVIWQEGTTRLLDYGLSGGGRPVLVIPSLINRAYILDLTARRSFMRSLAEKGLRPFLVDWDAPGADEAGFSLDDYIAGRLGRILDVVLAKAGRPVLVGYCMGGLLALGLGVLRKADATGLVLMATPWDFHAPDPAQGQMFSSLHGPFSDAIRFCDGLPVDILQSLFTTIDPAGIQRKFRAFAQLNPKSAKARDFVALEDWLNDGVPLVKEVARECLFGWYAENRPVRGQWRVGGRAVLPCDFDKPVLALIPANDRIVPPASALALASALPRSSHRVVQAGHIGMITGARAKTNVYNCISDWILRIEDQ
jgi:polyhydroxyalkanoate synthase